MSENLTFRLYQPEDISGVMRLWEESGWGAITEDQFNKWYVNTPFGECLTIVAVNRDDKIVGQEAFVPTKIYFDGEEKKALRFFAPILSKDLRLGTGSPMRDMFKFGMKIAVEKGYSMVYAFPAFVFFRLTKFFVAPEINSEAPQNTALDCYSLSLESFSKDDEVSDFKAQFVTDFNQDFDNLWKEAKDAFPIKCGIVRDSRWLQWKLGGRWTLAVRNSENVLLGYVSIDKKSSLMVDALARTPQDLEKVVGASLGKLRETQDLDLKEIKVMKTDVTQNIIEKFGFTRIDFKFAFWRYSIDDSISREMLDLSHWYVMPND